MALATFQLAPVGHNCRPQVTTSGVSSSRMLRHTDMLHHVLRSLGRDLSNGVPHDVFAPARTPESPLEKTPC